MIEPLSFNFIDFSQTESLSEHHPLIFMECNKRHNPINFMNKLRQSPDILDDFPFFFYVYREDRIIASVKSISDILSYQTKKHKWAWTGDLFTDPDYRGQGAASFLWKNMIEVLLQRNYFVGGAFSNPITTHICRKMGFTVPNKAHRLVLLKNSRAFLSYHSKYIILNKIIDAIYSAFISMVKNIHLKLSKTRRSKFSIREWDLANDSYDQKIFDKFQPTNCYHFNDEAPKLKWKIEHEKGLDLYVLTERQSQNQSLFFILKNRHIADKYAGRYTNFNLMTLMNFGTENDNKLGPMLDFIESMFWNSNADILEIVTSNPAFVRKAYYRGFVKAGKGVEFWFKAPVGIELNANSKQIENWHFTHFVSDSYSFS